MSAMLFSLVSALLLSKGALAIGTPFGYAAGTTGGGSASPAVPSSTAQLVSWLGDSTPRVILLDKTYDFTDSEGSVTAKACKPWTCSPNPQLAIDANEWCEHYEPNASMTTVTYKKAGTTAIKVASNKTLLGKGTAGAIKGKGLRIAGGDNIIIQNVRISDINAQFVWGGDAISIDGGSKIWIDHNYFKNVGRQFIVTGYGAAKSITISDNVFDGASTYSATCNGRHYWTLLFTGASDSITLARNYLTILKTDMPTNIPLQSRFTSTTTILLILLAMLWMLALDPRHLSRATTSTRSPSHPPLVLRDQSLLPTMLPPRPNAAPTLAASVLPTPCFLVEPRTARKQQAFLPSRARPRSLEQLSWRLLKLRPMFRLMLELARSTRGA
ncbi:pectin lyase [Rhizoctonia solani 123E]|uniref:pectin lyase n=1 Tax=Rhizoctonia solani 123E TaxID=1423351 RepID=A0A074S9D9_9AGAM|nr:pectin lyase [Rhizoctonia solani 123E]